MSEEAKSDLFFCFYRSFTRRNLVERNFFWPLIEVAWPTARHPCYSCSGFLARVFSNMPRIHS
jgi:hypothetical protein